jgi:membrane associated rhomboid family serine protease
MLVPYHVDVPMERVPWANWGLMAFITLVSVSILHFGETSNGPDLDPLIERVRQARSSEETIEAVRRLREAAARDTGPGTHVLAMQPEHFRWWQLFTNQFVHGSYWHLFGNLLFLFVFGNAVNAKLGHLRYVVIYLLLDILPSLVLLATGDLRPSYGASAAIFGVVGLYLIFFPRNDALIFYWIFGVWIGIWRVSGYVIILLFVAFDLLALYLSGGLALGALAHVVGALEGITLGIFLIKGGRAESDAGEENLLQFVGLSD